MLTLLLILGFIASWLGSMSVSHSLRRQPSLTGLFFSQMRLFLLASFSSAFRYFSSSLKVKIISHSLSSGIIKGLESPSRDEAAVRGGSLSKGFLSPFLFSVLHAGSHFVVGGSALLRLCIWHYLNYLQKCIQRVTIDPDSGFLTILSLILPLRDRLLPPVMLAPTLKFLGTLASTIAFSSFPNASRSFF